MPRPRPVLLLPVALAAAGLLAACMAVPRLPRPDPGAPPFDAIAFFSGHSEGEASLRVLWRRPTPVHVVSDGRIERDGSLVLVQSITEAGKKPRRRSWHIRAVAPGRYAGTLTPDAVGPVSGAAGPGRLTLAYPMKGGMQVAQELVLAPGGQAAENLLKVSRFGVTIAVLRETIRRTPPAPPPPGAPG